MAMSKKLSPVTQHIADLTNEIGVLKSQKAALLAACIRADERIEHYGEFADDEVRKQLASAIEQAEKT